MLFLSSQQKQHLDSHLCKQSISLHGASDVTGVMTEHFLIER